MIEQYIETGKGLNYHFLEPVQHEIDIEDIALSLSNKCRFSGHTRFFSVAEHSLTVAYRLPKRLRLAGLLHDAAEAYLGDIPSPIKAVLPDYRKLEKLNEQVIFKKFKLDDLTEEDWYLVKNADLEALYTEAHFLLPSGGKGWSHFQQDEWEVQMEFAPKCLPPAIVYKMFMDAYQEFSGEKKLILLKA